MLSQQVGRGTWALNSTELCSLSIGGGKSWQWLAVMSRTLQCCFVIFCRALRHIAASGTACCILCNCTVCWIFFKTLFYTRVVRGVTWWRIMGRQLGETDGEPTLLYILGFSLFGATLHYFYFTSRYSSSGLSKMGKRIYITFSIIASSPTNIITKA